MAPAILAFVAFLPCHWKLLTGLFTALCHFIFISSINLCTLDMGFCRSGREVANNSLVSRIPCLHTQEILCPCLSLAESLCSSPGFLAEEATVPAPSQALPRAVMLSPTAAGNCSCVNSFSSRAHESCCCSLEHPISLGRCSKVKAGMEPSRAVPKALKTLMSRQEEEGSREGGMDCSDL